ncbi:MAG: SIR2 family protein [Asticcacaulis sp.]
MFELPPLDALSLSLHHAPGTCALIIGSGLSTAAGIPTGWGIQIELIKRIASVRGVELTDDKTAEDWHLQNISEEINYSNLMKIVASTQSERQKIISQFIEGNDSSKPKEPTLAHRSIARLIKTGHIKVVITTNFDRLLENALRDEGVEPAVISSDSTAEGATPIVHSKCTIIKVHGDYLDRRILNTNDELEKYTPKINALLKSIFSDFGIITAGWSGEWDKALVASIERHHSKRYPFYWAKRGALCTTATRLTQHCGARVVDIQNANDFFGELEEKIAALSAASRPHPITEEIVIELAKKYCRDDRYQMEWEQLVYQQAEIAKKQMYSNVINYNKENSTFSESLKLSIDSMRPLRLLTLICSKYGNDLHKQCILKIIPHLSFDDISYKYKKDAPLYNIGSSLCYYWMMCGLIESWSCYYLKLLLSEKLIFNATPISFSDEYKFINSTFDDFSDFQSYYLFSTRNNINNYIHYLKSCCINDYIRLSLSADNACDAFENALLYTFLSNIINNKKHSKYELDFFETAILQFKRANSNVADRIRLIDQNYNQDNHKEIFGFGRVEDALTTVMANLAKTNQF